MCAKSIPAILVKKRSSIASSFLGGKIYAVNSFVLCIDGLVYQSGCISLRSQKFYLTDIADVIVKLFDNARGAFWTNLKEVREYPDKKLRMKAVLVIDQREVVPLAVDKEYVLEIIVTAQRHYIDGSGNCVGVAKVNLIGFSVINGAYHALLTGKLEFFSFNPTNLNRGIIEIINKFISKFK